VSPVSTRKGRTQAEQGNKSSSLEDVKYLTRPDLWAVNMDLKVDGKPFDLEGREYVTQVIRDYSPEIVIPKAAQMAFTVTFLTKSLHNVIVRKLNGLYLLPLKTGAITFVQARIDPIIDNPLLSKSFASVDNRLHKQSWNRVNLYIRGTNILRELQGYQLTSKCGTSATIWSRKSIRCKHQWMAQNTNVGHPGNPDSGWLRGLRG
jgi:hypothetical protein